MPIQASTEYSRSVTKFRVVNKPPWAWLKMNILLMKESVVRGGRLMHGSDK